jgi:hypothetical protein
MQKENKTKFCIFSSSMQKYKQALLPIDFISQKSL